jgi:precorrin-6A/cobalt-precorrin-6A reductase
MNILLLAGTHEAHRIAQTLTQAGGHSVTVSLAKPEIDEKDFGWPLRTGGFGGETVFSRWLERHNTEAIIDATHPFVEKMSIRTARVADILGIARARFLRPPWTASAQDTWVEIGSPTEAAVQIPRGATVFLGTGRADLAAFDGLRGCKILCRSRIRPTAPFPISGGRFLFQPGPFTVDGEIEFFKDSGVDWIVTRNSGGQGAWPKLEAARRLRLPVAMIQRPPVPDGPQFSTIDALMTWLAGLQT